MTFKIKVCRLCLLENNRLCNIFEYDSKELPNKILKCTKVEVLEHDGLPITACVTCIEMIEKFDAFRKQCQFSDSIIREKFANAENCSINVNVQNVEIEYNKTPDLELENTLNDLRTASKELTVNNETTASSKVNLDSDDDNDFDSSDSSADPDYNFDYDKYELSSNKRATYQSESIEKTIKKKKCKIKKNVHKINQKKIVKQHSLVYTDEDYAILGNERKVRIYEMDDTIREIIGENVYICEICTEEFTSFFEYFDHQETHNGKLVFMCNKCLEVFASRQGLVEHDARHKIPCRTCKLEVLPKSMTAHLLIHTDIYKCSECGMRHTSNASLEKHIKARHIGIKGFVCHVCGKQSSCQSSMNRHMAYHSNERPYKCKYCDFCAKSLNIVQVHTSRKHFAEKCVCEICAKLFKSQPSLIQHMKRIHTARKHICDICGKAFIERYNLNRHLKKHAGQRLHECKLCHKEFFTIRKLKEHMHSHRQGCVSCPKCGKEFFYKKYYNKHVLKCTKTENSIDNTSINLSLISDFK